MAGGSEVVGRFNGTLPGAGVRRAAPRATSSVYRTVQGQNDINAGAMSAVVGGFNYATHPVEYVTAAGLRPRTAADHAALVKYPELALHALNDSVQANGRMALSSGRHGGSAVHSTLGENYPIDAKASFSMGRVL